MKAGAGKQINKQLNMKELTVDEIKEISLKILRDVHEFCVANNIRYSLAYGTLLGAVRHHGFIPWDDDIDIMMPRPDYNRFIQSYRNRDSFEVFAPELRNSYIAYARATETKCTVVHSPAKWAPVEGGIWIDIFPVDGLESVDLDITSKTDRLKELGQKVLIRRYREALKEGSLKNKTKYLLHYIKDTIKGDTLWKLLDKMNTIRCEVGYNSRKRGIYEIIYKKTNVLPANVFDNYTLVDFGKDKFMSVVDADSVLSGIYGDYMKLPPVEERVYKHSAHRYYWKHSI